MKEWLLGKISGIANSVKHAWAFYALAFVVDVFFLRDSWYGILLAVLIIACVTALLFLRGPDIMTHSEGGRLEEMRRRSESEKQHMEYRKELFKLAIGNLSPMDRKELFELAIGNLSPAERNRDKKQE